jgi:FAD/FMN-containing dehydrogenase
LPSKSAGVRIQKKNFNQILHVDPEAGRAEIEGMATYEAIVEATLKYSCLPTVVPELKTITLGGAIAGCGIESSSFRYGLVHESILACDLLLADGSVITCTPDNQYQDLFFALPNSYGTFGYILKATIALQPAASHVRLQHEQFDSISHFFHAIETLCAENREKGASFIEGVIFTPEACTLTTGTFISQAPYESNYKYMNIYYRSIQKRGEDYLTASDYIWRWDTDWFWCSRVFYMQNPLMRFLFGKMFLNSSTYTRMMHLATRNQFLQRFSKAIRGESETVIQDVLIPVEKAEQFFNFFRKEVGIFPLWICPYRSFSGKRFDLCPLDPKRVYLDFGFWDSVPLQGQQGTVNRKIEQKVQELGGFKSLYSESYYSPEEFWQIYNKSRYQQLKQKYDPHNILGDLCTKCCSNFHHKEQ